MPEPDATPDETSGRSRRVKEEYFRVDQYPCSRPSRGPSEKCEPLIPSLFSKPGTYVSVSNFKIGKVYLLYYMDMYYIINIYTLERYKQIKLGKLDLVTCPHVTF